MNKKALFCMLFAGILFFGSSLQQVNAYSIEKLNFSNEGDIVVGPGKTELLLSPGDTSTQQIIVSNRSGMTKIINISVEDFVGSNNPDETVQFLGDQSSPYSLKDFVKPDVSQVTLNFGERLTLPVTISIPTNATPGGLYGAVMISASNPDNGSQSAPQTAAAGQVNVITRVASLFFVTVKGPIIQTGSLTDFKSDSGFYEAGPVNFLITSKNTGSVYLSPYGSIQVTNMFGQTVDNRTVDPWFVMPGVSRERQILWNSGFLFGRYTAILSLNRGYSNIVDSKSYSFWVIPWKIILIILIGLVLVVWFFIWVASHFEFKKKK